MKKAIILFGHGSRDPLWRGPMEAVAQRLASRQSDLSVCNAYLEYDQPDLATAAAQLARAGATHVTIVPMFLGTGKHARENLPVLTERLRMQYPTITLTLQQAVGEDARLLDLLADIALE